MTAVECAVLGMTNTQSENFVTKSSVKKSSKVPFEQVLTPSNPSHIFHWKNRITVGEGSQQFHVLLYKEGNLLKYQLTQGAVVTKGDVKGPLSEKVKLIEPLLEEGQLSFVYRYPSTSPTNLYLLKGRTNWFVQRSDEANHRCELIPIQLLMPSKNCSDEVSEELLGLFKALSTQSSQPETVKKVVHFLTHCRAQFWDSQSLERLSLPKVDLGLSQIPLSDSKAEGKVQLECEYEFKLFADGKISVTLTKHHFPEMEITDGKRLVLFYSAPTRLRVLHSQEAQQKTFREALGKNYRLDSTFDGSHYLKKICLNFEPLCLQESLARHCKGKALVTAFVLQKEILDFELSLDLPDGFALLESPRFPIMEVEPVAFPCVLDITLPISYYRWGIFLINKNGISDQHASLVINGIYNGFCQDPCFAVAQPPREKPRLSRKHFPQEGKPFSLLVDYTGTDIRMIFLKSVEYSGRTKVFLKSVETITEMLKYVSGSPLPEHYATLPVFNQDNCTTWALDILMRVGIQLKSAPLRKLATIPFFYTKNGCQFTYQNEQI